LIGVRPSLLPANLTGSFAVRLSLTRERRNVREVAFTAISSALLYNMNSVREWMQRLGIRDVDLEESFARSSGPGGQNVNKVATAVTLRHRPSGISVTVQDSRSQAVNRKLARERLFNAIEEAQRKRRASEIAKREKERRRKSPRPPALKRKILESKRKRGDLKQQRARIKI